MNLLHQLLKLYPNKDWDWKSLSANPAVDIVFIVAHPGKWDWSVLCTRLNVPLEFLIVNSKYKSLECVSKNPHLAEETILTNLQFTRAWSKDGSNRAVFP